MSKNWFDLFIVAMYIFMIFGAGIFLSWMTIQKKKNIARMKDNIKSKLSENLPITAKEVVFIGRGFELSPKNSRDVIYRLFADTNESENYKRLKELVSDIEKEEPFDELPDEVKPSLLRIINLAENSGDPSDKHILLPITSTLNKYVELKSDQEKVKKQTSRAYVITIVSFVVGAISFYFTLKSPGEVDIKHALEQVLIERAKNTGQQN